MQDSVIALTDHDVDQRFLLQMFQVYKHGTTKGNRLLVTELD